VAGQPLLGDPAAPVTMAVFEDFRCPGCQSFELNVMPDLRRDYVETGRVRVAYFNLPVVNPVAASEHVARVGECVFRQSNEAFWEMKTPLYRAQPELGNARRVVELATTYAPGIDPARSTPASATRQPAGRARRRRQLATRLNVRSTPTVIVNGVQVSSPSASAVRAALDAALPELIVSNRGVWTYGAWLVAIAATVGSLYFSEVRQFVPCTLCWWQRIFMYPLVVVLGVATFRQDTRSGARRCRSRWSASPRPTYHYLLQKVPAIAPPASCALGVPCNVQYINWFGFVTIPFLALVAFASHHGGDGGVAEGDRAPADPRRAIPARRDAARLSSQAPTPPRRPPHAGRNAPSSHRQGERDPGERQRRPSPVVSRPDVVGQLQRGGDAPDATPSPPRTRRPTPSWWRGRRRSRSRPSSSPPRPPRRPHHRPRRPRPAPAPGPPTPHRGRRRRTGCGRAPAAARPAGVAARLPPRARPPR
jgi:disulfide bond formation protein DsbB